MLLRTLTRKKHRQMKLQRLQKVQIWSFWLLVQQINSVGTKFPKKKIIIMIIIKQLLAKLRSLRQVHFVVTILFVLTLPSDMPVLHGNDAFSNLVLSNEKQYPSFLKKVFVLQKSCFKVNPLKKFKIFRLSHKNMPIFQTEGYFENPQYRILEEPMLFLLTLK